MGGYLLVHCTVNLKKFLQEFLTELGQGNRLAPAEKSLTSFKEERVYPRNLSVTPGYVDPLNDCLVSGGV